jgi:hypothetical protein
MLNYLHFKTIYSRRQNPDTLFLLNVFQNKINCCSIMDAVDLHVPLSILETFPLLTSVMSPVMSQDLALEQGASRLQTSANLWTFSLNITSPLRIHFPLFNPSELNHYRVACIILLPKIKFQSSSSSSSSSSLN